LTVRLGAGPLPENSFDLSPFCGYFLTAFLTTLTAACLGLAVSVLSAKPDQAMAVAPLLLLPQILFADVIFELEGLLRGISSVIPCKLSMQGFGILTDFNALNISEYVPADPQDMYEATSANLYWSWVGLGIFAIVCVVVFAAALKMTKENN
jgi:ABC-type transport system involved in multi-copper enzyme maturation permease subunit